jgi:hypothetical protein
MTDLLRRHLLMRAAAVFATAATLPRRALADMALQDPILCRGDMRTMTQDGLRIARLRPFGEVGPEGSFVGFEAVLPVALVDPEAGVGSPGVYLGAHYELRLKWDWEGRIYSDQGGVHFQFLTQDLDNQGRSRTGHVPSPEAMWIENGEAAPAEFRLPWSGAPETEETWNGFLHNGR